MTKNDLAKEILEPLLQSICFIINDYQVRINFGYKNNNIDFSIRNFFNCVGTFMSSMFQLGWFEYVVQVIKNIIPVIHMLVDHFYDMPLIYMGCVDFMTNLFCVLKYADTKNPDMVSMLSEVILEFVPSSFNIVFNQQIEFLDDVWRNLMRSLFSFHSKVANRFGIENIDQALSKFGAPPEFSQSYLSITKESGNVKESFGLFFNQLWLFFKGLEI